MPLTGKPPAVMKSGTTGSLTDTPLFPTIPAICRRALSAPSSNKPESRRTISWKGNNKSGMVWLVVDIRRNALRLLAPYIDDTGLQVTSFNLLIMDVHNLFDMDYEMRKYIIFFIVITFMLAPKAYCEGIWPFNTPEMEASLICKNAADQAEHAAKRRFAITYEQFLEEFQDPYWLKPENYLTKREYIRAIRIAYQNQNITPGTIKKMVKEDCNARKSKLVEEIKRQKPLR